MSDVQLEASYCPAEMVELPNYDPQLISKADQYLLESTASHDLELELAKSLASESIRHFNAPIFPGSLNYRAESAMVPKTDQNKGSGNCFAHTEATISAGLQLGLDMYMGFNGVHASALWIARTALWDVDGFTSRARLFDSICEHRPVFRDKVQTIGRKLIHQAGGRIFLQATPSYELLSQPIVGELGINVCSFERPTTILPGKEGVQFLSAFGDLVNLQATDPERAMVESGQIKRFIPMYKATLL